MSWQALMESGKVLEAIHAVRTELDCGMMHAKALLYRFDGDVLLAAGYGKYTNKAVTIKKAGLSDAEAYERWNLACAESFKRTHAYDNGVIIPLPAAKPGNPSPGP